MISIASMTPTLRNGLINGISTGLTGTSGAAITLLTNNLFENRP